MVDLDTNGPSQRTPANGAIALSIVFFRDVIGSFGIFGSSARAIVYCVNQVKKIKHPCLFWTQTVDTDA